MGRHKLRDRVAAAALALWVGACGETDDGVAETVPAATPAQTAAAPPPAMALAYQAGDGRTEARIAEAQDAVRAHPDQPAAHAALARSFMKRARETSSEVYRAYARDVLTAARRHFAHEPELRTLSAMLLLDEHAFEAAAEEARDLLAARKLDPTPRLILGDAMLELGRYDDAVDAYQSAIDLRPDLRSYNRAAYMRWIDGDFAAAREIMDLAIDAGSLRDPESIAWCFADLSVMFLSQGEVGPAIAAADRALALVPEYGPAATAKARALAHGGHDEVAADVLTAAVARRPGVEDLLSLAEIHARRGAHEDAEAARAEAERLSTHDPRPLAHYLARHAETPARALALAERELRQRRTIWAWDTVALARLRTGDVDGAAEAMSHALGTGFGGVDFVLHRALIESARGETGEAKRLLALALARDPHADPILVAELGRRVGDA